MSSRTTFDIPAFDLDGKKHNARLAYTIAKHGVVRWAHTHGNAQRQELLARANPFLEEAPVSYLRWLEDNEREYFKKILCASFGNGKMQTVFRAHLTEHLADKRELVQPAVPPNIFDDVELPAEEVGAGADGAAAVEGVPKIASRVQECKSLSSRTTFDIPAFDLDGKKHNARLAYTIAKHGVVRWAHTHGNAQRQELLARANPFLEEAPVSYLRWLEDNEREYFKKILCASFGNGKMQTVFRAHLTEHLADKRELVQPAVPPNIFDDVELPAEEVGAGEAAAEGVTPPTPVPSAPSSHLSPGTVERVADAMVQGMVARITPLHERTHSAVRDTHSAVLQGTAEVKSEVKNSAAEVKAEVKAGATEVKALILHSQEKAVKGFAALAMQNAQSLAQMMQALGLVTEHVTEAVTEAAKAAVEATERVGAVAEKTLTEASGARAAAVGAEAAATEGLCVTREVLAIVKEMETRLDALAFEKDKKEAIVGLLVNAPVARELSGCNKIIGTCVDLIQGLPSVEESRAADAEEALRAEAAAKAEAEAAAAAKRTASLRGGSAGLARAPPNASNTPKIVSKKPKAAPASGRGGTKAALTVAVETIAAPESDFLNASDKQVALRELITLLPMVPNENLLELLAPKGYVTLALVCALSYKKSAVVTTAAEVRAHAPSRCTRAPLHAPPALVRSTRYAMAAGPREAARPAGVQAGGAAARPGHDPHRAAAVHARQGRRRVARLRAARALDDGQGAFLPGARHRPRCDQA